jgi:acyl phosphate:glycerol-3-phosphate acyltransferase
MPLSLILILTAYAMGCLNTGYYLVRALKGADIREAHSRSAGARNAGRLLGAGGFAAVFAGDALKGALIIWAARLAHADARLIPWLVPVCVAGHIWPAQMGFRGGKGFATVLGSMLGLDIRFALAGLGLYFLPRLHPRGRPLSGIAPMLVLPWLPFPGWSLSQSAALALACASVLFAHRGHLRPEPAANPEPGGRSPAPEKATR